MQLHHGFGSPRWERTAYTASAASRKPPQCGSMTDLLLLPAAALCMLPPGRAVVIQGRAAPVIVRLEQARHRADYKRQQPRPGPAALPGPASRQLPADAPALPGRPPAGPAAPDELTPRPDHRTTVP